MKITNKYPKLITDFYIKNEKLFKNIANQIKRKYYSIPIDVDDLLSFTLYKFYTIDVQKIYFELKISIEKFVMSRIKYYMYSFCNAYINNKHKIMNNYIFNDDENMSSCNINYYNESEIFIFLTNKEFEIIYDLKVLKLKRKIVAKNYNMSLSHLKNLEINIIKKIKNYYND